ncbi:HEAT repeat domain-containing protein [Paenibacillus albiflavus]|uniref:HEAT repeat domain-containing protein n=1 Tax=Paenibacillus albiflavus TaxID=2545760 RepID=UPI001A9CC105|nr:HEAT repeat domain-containing protein [Paenibacillus albiflavus]
MTKEYAISILKKYTPMPDDQDLTAEMIDEYASAILYFEEYPDPSCIEPIMMTFSLDDLYGTYEHAACVLRSFTNDQVVPHLIKALYSEHEGIRYWGANIAKFFPDSRLLNPLLNCVNDSNEEIREYATYARTCIGYK